MNEDLADELAIRFSDQKHTITALGFFKSMLVNLPEVGKLPFPLERRKIRLLHPADL
jgi:hypothetical protein